MNPLFRIDFSISDSLKIVRKSVLIYETIIFGGVIVACSVVAFIYTLVSYFMGHVSPGWSSLMISIWFLGGVQLLFIGVVGQYVGKTYIESKERPRYNVEKFLNHEE